MIIGGLDTRGTPEETRRTPVLQVSLVDFHTGRSLDLGWLSVVPMRGLKASVERRTQVNFGVSNGGDEVIPSVTAFTLESFDV